MIETSNIVTSRMTADLDLAAHVPNVGSASDKPAPISAPLRKHRIAYILAASHSGSTLLAMLLGSHPKVCTVGELKGVSRIGPEIYRCSCGTILEECTFWNTVSAAMRERGYDFNMSDAGTRIDDVRNPAVRRFLAPLHRGPVLEKLRDAALNLCRGWRAHLQMVQNRNAALVGTLKEITGASVVVDSSKTGVRLKYLLRNPALDVRVIRVLRDGRAVSLTHTNPAEFADAADPQFRLGGSGVKKPNFRLSMPDAVMLWRRSNEEADRIVATLDKSQCAIVRYEDLCERTDTVLQSLFDFAGVARVPFNAKFREQKAQHIVGNGMRFDAHSPIRSDERWKTHLAAADLKLFGQLGGDLNRKYGYS
jgi:hypothetical protein